MQLTDAEKKAIKSFKRLAKQWPASLWLFSASGTMTIMKKNSSGEKPMTRSGGVDQKFIADTVDIENDGGDW